jgi:hypothetical protein
MKLQLHMEKETLTRKVWGALIRFDLLQSWLYPIHACTLDILYQLQLSWHRRPHNVKLVLDLYISSILSRNNISFSSCLNIIEIDKRTQTHPLSRPNLSDVQMLATLRSLLHYLHYLNLFGFVTGIVYNVNFLLDIVKIIHLWDQNKSKKHYLRKEFYSQKP